HICAHGYPARHRGATPYCLGGGINSSGHEPMSCWNGLYSRERVADWRYWALQARTLRELIRIARSGEDPTDKAPGLLTQLSQPAPWTEAYASDELAVWRGLH